MAEESKIIANEIIKPSGVQEKPLEERNIEVMKELMSFIQSFYHFRFRLFYSNDIRIYMESAFA